MLFNFASSVGIITLNKVVFKTYAFNYPTFLTGLHFVATFLGLCICNAFGQQEEQQGKQQQQQEQGGDDAARSATAAAARLRGISKPTVMRRSQSGPRCSI